MIVAAISLEHRRAPIHVLARTRSQAKVVQADTLLVEPLGTQRWVTGFDTDRRPTSDAVKELVAIKHRLHSKLE
jgi:hypothetical protein